jgi:hypothetical protein
MKANNACGRGLLIKDGMLVARKKQDVDFIPIPVTDDLLRSYASEWLTTPYAPKTEKQYQLIKPMIIFEEYLENLTLDIQLYCFCGKVPLVAVIFRDNYLNIPARSFYDADWNFIPVKNPWFPVNNSKIDCPKAWEKIVALSKKLTQNIDHVRVDFFGVGDEIYFGEFTFTSNGGNRNKFPSSHYEVLLGNYWTYPEVDSF